MWSCCYMGHMTRKGIEILWGTSLGTLTEKNLETKCRVGFYLPHIN